MGSFNFRSGLGGFASGMASGIRTGIEVREFQREEEKYQKEKRQEEALQKVTEAMPTSTEIASYQQEEINPQVLMYGAASGAPPTINPPDKIRQQEDMIRRSDIPYERKQELLAQLQKARVGGFSIASAAAMGTEDPTQRAKLMNDATGLLGFVGKNYFTLSEDGNVVMEDVFGMNKGQPIPAEVAMMYLAQQFQEDPVAAVNTVYQYRLKEEADALEAARRTEDIEYRNNRLAVEREGVAASAKLAAAREKYMAYTAETDRINALNDYSALLARATGKSQGAIKDIVTQVDKYTDDERSYGEHADLISNHHGEWKSLVDRLAIDNNTLSPGAPTIGEVVELSNRILAAKYGDEKTDPLNFDPIKINGVPSIGWRNPNSNQLILVPPNAVRELKDSMDPEEWAKFEAWTTGSQSAGGAPPSGAPGPTGAIPMEGPQQSSYVELGEGIRSAVGTGADVISQVGTYPYRVWGGIYDTVTGNPPDIVREALWGVSDLTTSAFGGPPPSQVEMARRQALLLDDEEQ